jgi:hypothetical protein
MILFLYLTLVYLHYLYLRSYELCILAHYPPATVIDLNGSWYRRYKVNTTLINQKC